MSNKTDALRMALEALETGLECAQEVAARIHYELAGYKPEKHAAADKDVEEIKAAIAALSAQVESN